ncbi:MAG: VOC family protein [Fimbriimonadaceae bacterium]|nr:VOC family protein [Fimbriimonadaceae bacterium]
MNTIQAPILGLHHMTAIVADAQRSVDFYVGALGLRSVKLTVNFDDPTAYHLYFGDAIGSPGTALTFFPYADGRQARVGSGQVAVTRLAVPTDSLEFWRERLVASGVRVADAPAGTDPSLAFQDPDGLRYALVEVEGRTTNPWPASPVPAERAILGMHSVEIWSRRPEATGGVLESIFGYQKVQVDGDRTRYAVRDGCGGSVDVVQSDAVGNGGHGGVHHIAFRTPDAATQLALHDKVHEQGLHVSPVMERNYFRSVYFREPGGVLFEIATDGPGFLIDEPFESLGVDLKLPEQYESQRAWIESRLPKLRFPGVTA